MLQNILNRLRKTPPLHMIVHVGMHKTGTSSIQSTFFHRNNPDFEYVDWTGPNHNELFVLLFLEADRLSKYKGFVNKGPELIRQLPDLRSEWLAKFTDQISNTNAEKMLFSAENISLPNMDRATQALHDCVSAHSRTVAACGYVRNPYNLVESLFQQNLKYTNLTAFMKGQHRPNYKRRFQHIDRAFGRKNVTLKEYTPDRLLNGDVVQDFAQTIGVEIPEAAEMKRTNESLSLEACACLYVQRVHGKGYVAGFKGAPKANGRFIKQLSTLGDRKLVFQDAMIDKYFGDVSKDLIWIEKRIGHSFSYQEKPSTNTIASLDDLVDVALENYDAIQTRLGADRAISGKASFDNLVKSLEALREKSYDSLGRGKAQRRGQKSRTWP